MIPRVVCYQEIPGSDHHLLQNVNDPISLILNLNGHKQVYIPYKTVVSTSNSVPEIAMDWCSLHQNLHD